MKASSLAAGCVLLSLVAPPAFADPAAELKAVLSNFLNQPSYSWNVGPATRGGQEEPRGQYEKGGYSKIHLMAGPHISREEMPATKSRVGFTDDEALSSERWVFETPEGWKALKELPTPSRPGGLPSRPGPAAGSTTSHRAFATRRPHHEIAVMLEYLTTVEALGGGGYRAEIDAAGAEKLIVFPTARPMPGPAIQIENGGATATLWVKDGTLVRYELAVTGTRVMPGNTRLPSSYKVTREFSNIGTTVVDVPPEVRTKLAR